MFKKVYSLYSAFYPSLRFTLSLQSAFYTQSAFYPWSAVCSLQSAVRSPQSASYTDRNFNCAKEVFNNRLILFVISFTLSAYEAKRE